MGHHPSFLRESVTGADHSINKQTTKHANTYALTSPPMISIALVVLTSDLVFWVFENRGLDRFKSFIQGAEWCHADQCAIHYPSAPRSQGMRIDDQNLSTTRPGSGLLLVPQPLLRMHAKRPIVLNEIPHRVGVKTIVNRFGMKLNRMV